MLAGVTIYSIDTVNNFAISKLSFIISVIIILSDTIARIFKVHLNETSLMSFVLSIFLS
ncbi:hypothetical protein [Niallia sp.]|uniref:hypothetical protein n=1 Tax=Niallia sp. TaxID=2837523 RepID=UPI0028A15AA8|nr:hypothetical protein [Niallia sp.]